MILRIFPKAIYPMVALHKIVTLVQRSPPTSPFLHHLTWLGWTVLLKKFEFCITHINFHVEPSVLPIWVCGCTIEPPFIWFIQKCMLIWKVCLYSSSVFAICSSKMKTRHVTRDQFTEKVLSGLDNFNSRNPFTYYDWTIAPRGFLR